MFLFFRFITAPDFAMDFNFLFFVRFAVLFHTVSGIRIHEGHQHIPTNKQFSFPVMRQYMPYGKHLKIKRLLRKLGEEFNSEWMSIELPRLANYVPDNSHNPKNDIQTVLEKSRLVHVIDLYATELKLNNQSKEIIESFLQTMSRCQTDFEWEDLGSLFWPRYVKSGSCSSVGTCSWPTGMLCQASEVKTLRLLHWRCIRRKQEKKETNRKSKNKNVTIGRIGKSRRITGAVSKKLKCRWKKIPYEITASCGCSC